MGKHSYDIEAVSTAPIELVFEVIADAPGWSRWNRKAVRPRRASSDVRATRMKCSASPAPVKYALSRLFPDISPAVRLPLVECSDEAKRAVDDALIHAGLL